MIFLGTPGAAWTEAELLVTKAKIRWVMQKPKNALASVEGGAEALELYKSREGKDMSHAILPNLPKFVRLNFHDCVKEVTGAGCNGCLNFESMGAMFSRKSCASRRSNCSDTAGGIHPERGPFKTDNNNLLWTAKVLEEIYMNPSAGSEHNKALHYNESLFESGKSRADLWAFAGLVALQKSVENNNRQCDPEKPAPCSNQVNKDSPNCNIDIPVLQFKSGRSDCTPSCSGDNDYPFCTSVAEVHPNPHGNGTDTTQFFENNFNLTPRESVALMGVHTLGHPMEVNSMFRHYGWTPQGRTEFNNQYFINIANTTNYMHVNAKKLLADKNVANCNLSASYFVGDEYGNPMPVGYKVRSERRTNAFGPWNWSLMGSSCSVYLCTNISSTGTYHFNSCCNWMETCKTNPMGCPFKKKQCGGPEEAECELYSNFQRTSMLSVDMGLNLKFEANEDGRPVGCPGMNGRWMENRQIHSELVECELNNEPGDDSHTMSELVQHFAAEQDVWVNEFKDVYLKMIENGVNVEDLVASSNSWMAAVCNDKRGKCFFKNM